MNNRDPRGVVIVGASLAGLRTAEALRGGGYEGTLTLIGDEPHFPPFDRPTLSKEMLTGERAVDDCRLHARELNAHMILGRTAARLDLEERSVLLNDSSTVSFDRLVVATGTVPRLLPIGESVEGVFVLRAMEDSVRLRGAIGPGTKVVVVGAGFIGCEVAASARKLGAEVTVVESRDRPLALTMGPLAGELLTGIHHSHDVTLTFDRSVAGITEEQRNGRPVLGTVLLDDGTELPADVMVVAIGVVPSTDWLIDSGLKVDDGVVCDQHCMADGAEGIYAAGDVAKWFHPLFQRHLRVEHWTNAFEQGRHVGRSLAASDPSVYDSVPYFWSHQYDKNLQFVGLVSADERSTDFDRVNGRGLITYHEGDTMVGALLVDTPQRVAEMRAAVKSHALARAAE